MAEALLDAARQWVVERGAKFLRGPVNPSTNYECGMLVDGFDSSPMVMMTYNPPYYPGLMEQAGLTKAKDLYAYLSNANTIDMEKIERVADKVLKDQRRARPSHQHEGFRARSGARLGGLRRGLEPQLGIRPDDPGRILR